MLGKTVMTLPTSGISKGSIFFLHGTCDSGPGLKSWLAKILSREFQFKNYKIIYPSSPMIPYSLMNGQNARVWYDRISPGPNMPEDQVSINQMGEWLNKVIQEEQSLNEGKVIVGGFSLGGSMAIHLGYRLNQSIAGVFALSSFLPPCSSVFSSLGEFVKENPQVESEEFTRTIISKDGKMANTGKKESRVSQNKLPKLFMSRGAKDPLVRPRWTHSTFTQLRDHGIESHLYTFPRESHEISSNELSILHNWIDETFDTPKIKPRRQPRPFHINDKIAVPIPFWPKNR